MPGIVVDVSACTPWCCEDEANESSEKLLDSAAGLQPLHVPSLWPWELMNAVAVATRRGRIPADRAAHFFDQISAFDFRIASAPSIGDFARLSSLAARRQLTAYDGVP